MIHKDKHSDFNLKLNNIEAHKVGIPNMEYEASVRLPSNEFQKIIQSLQPLGDAGMLKLHCIDKALTWNSGYRCG